MSKKQTYLYLIERVTNKSSWSKLANQCEVKIGITTNIKARFESISETVVGKVVLSYYVPLRRAYRVEQRLHVLFSDSNFRMKRKRGEKSNGETEWFYMSWLEMITLHLWLFYYKHEGSVWFLFVVISLVGYRAYLEYLNNIIEHKEILFKWER